eukprot:jgi/Psemu1/5686/gm1.5686_g
MKNLALKNAWGKGRPKAKNTPKKKFQGRTVGLEDHIFYYGKGMNTKWLSSKEKLLNYIGKKKYTMSEATSIENGTKKLIGIAEPTTKHVNKNLFSCYAIIWGRLTLTLRNKLKAETTFPVIEQSKDTPGLFKLITTICNGTSTIGHKPTTIVTKYYKHFAKRQKAAELCDFDTPCSKVEAIMKAQLPYTGTTKQEAAAYVAMIRVNQQEQFYAIMFMKEAGDRFEECRRDINNVFTKGTDHILQTINDAYALLQNYEAT